MEMATIYTILQVSFLTLVHNFCQHLKFNELIFFRNTFCTLTQIYVLLSANYSVLP